MSATVQPVRGTLADGSVPVTNVGGAGGGTSSNFGAAFPSAGTAAGFIDASGNMAGANLDASGFLKVNIAAGSSSGTQYTEDVAAAADPIGTAVNLIRNDTPTAITSTDGDNIAQRGTNFGAGFVQVITSAGAFVDSFGGGTQYTEDAAAAANPIGTALNLVRDDARAGGLTTTDGDNVAARGTNAGELYVKHVDSIAVTNAGLTELAAAINGSSQLDINIAAQTLGTLTVASHAVTNAGTFAVQESGSALTALQLIDDTIKADDAGFTVGTDKVSMAGVVAVAHGSNPDAADANDAVAIIANRHRVPFFIGGHPNIITTEYLWTTAQTDDAVVTISTGSKIVVTQLQVTIDEATTVGVGFRVGFATSTLPTAPTDGTAVAGYLASHRGLVPGTGLSRGDGAGILGIGADDEDLRITCEAPTSGSASLVVSYYTIPS